MTISQNSLSFCADLALINGYTSEDFANFIAFKSKIPAVWANFVAGRGIVSPQEIDDIIMFYDGLPFEWCVNKVDQGLLDHVLEAGLKQLDTIFGMRLIPSRFKKIESQYFVAKKITSPEEFESWVVKNAEGFGYNVDLLRQFYMPLFNKKEIFSFYSCYYKDHLTATCCTFKTHGNHEIHSLSTIPLYRKRGAATTVLCKAIEDLFAGGADDIHIQSREEGFLVFKHLGFELTHEFAHMVKE